MASNVDKLSKFNSAINHYAEAQRAKILEDIEAFKEKELKETEATAKLESERLIIKEVAAERSNIVREMSHKELDARRELLEKRQKIADKVFDRAKKVLVDFTTMPEYTVLLERFAKEFSKSFAKPGTVIYIKPGDEKYQPKIEAAFGITCTFKADEKITIGGIRAENTSLHLAADSTLDAILESQRGWFEENSGMAVV